MKNVPLPVLVTAVGGGGFGEQILKALRLADTPYEIVGCDVSSLSKGLVDVDHPYLVPPASDDRYINAVLAMCRRHGVRAVLPGSEPELRALSKRRAEFEDRGILVPINPDTVIDTCLNKASTMAFLQKRGFSCPRTLRIDTEDDLSRVDFFPAVLKPYIGGGGSVDVAIVQDSAELSAIGRWLIAAGRKLIVQEYVGTPECEFTVGVLLSMNGELINSIAVRRILSFALSTRLKVCNRTDRVDLGPTLIVSSGISQGVIGPFPDVTQPCERLALELGCRGAVNIQCRYVDDKPCVFEINPRFSGTTSLRAVVGYNEPDVLIRLHILGERVQSRFAYRTGTIVRGLCESLIECDNTPQAIDL